MIEKSNFCVKIKFKDNELVTITVIAWEIFDSLLQANYHIEQNRDKWPYEIISTKKIEQAGARDCSDKAPRNP